VKTANQTVVSPKITVVSLAGDEDIIPPLPAIPIVSQEETDALTEATSGEEILVSWHGTPPPDVIDYEVQWRGNGGAWENVYSGHYQEFTDIVPDVYDSFQYQVRSVNTTTEVVSEWVEGDVVTINHNKRPVISGENVILGTFDVTSPSYTYTITDNENDAVIVSIWVDGIKLSEFIPVLGQEYTYATPSEVWPIVSNGQHRLQIRVIDQHDRVANRTITYIKNIDKIAFSLPPLITNDIPTSITLMITGILPAGSELTVYACNNAFDAEPTWEDITQNIILETSYNFKNNTKVAPNWGISLRLQLKRKDGVGPCYIKSLSGKYITGISADRLFLIEMKISQIEEKLDQLLEAMA
jgi:hypothetical protein